MRVILIIVTQLIYLLSFSLAKLMLSKQQYAAVYVLNQRLGTQAGNYFIDLLSSGTLVMTPREGRNLDFRGIDAAAIDATRGLPYRQTVFFTALGYEESMREEDEENGVTARYRVVSNQSIDRLAKIAEDVLDRKDILELHNLYNLRQGKATAITLEKREDYVNLEGPQASMGGGVGFTCKTKPVCDDANNSWYFRLMKTDYCVTFRSTPAFKSVWVQNQDGKDSHYCCTVQHHECKIKPWEKEKKQPWCSWIDPNTGQCYDRNALSGWCPYR